MKALMSYLLKALFLEKIKSNVHVKCIFWWLPERTFKWYMIVQNNSKGWREDAGLSLEVNLSWRSWEVWDPYKLNKNHL